MRGIIWGSTMLTALAIGIIATIIFLGNIPVEEIIEPKEREWTVVAGPSPAQFAAAGTTGIVGIYILGHLGNPAGGYATNLTVNATMYAYESTHYNKSLGGNVLANTYFDIIIKVRVIQSDLVNGTVHQLSWCRMNMTCSHTTPPIGALTAMTQQNITDQSLGDPIDSYQNYYLNNAGTGYYIDPGQNCNVTAFVLEIFQ